MLEIVAISKLVRIAPMSSLLARNSWYQRSVNPCQGNDTNVELLKEKTIKITIGAYRKTTSAQKNTTRLRRPPEE